MKKLLKFVSVSALLIISFTAFGETERWYRVELIVFEHQNPSAEIAEKWLSNTQEPALEDSIQLIPQFTAPQVDGIENEIAESPLEDITVTPSPIPIPFQQLADHDLELVGKWRALDSNENYLPLVHRAWVQPALESKTTWQVRITTETPKVPVDLNSDAELENEKPLIMIAPSNSAPEAMAQNSIGLEIDAPTIEIPAVDDGSQESEMPPKELVKLDGTVRIRVSRYLHLDTDLIYREQFAPETAAVIEIDPDQIRSEQAGVSSVEDRPGLATQESTLQKNAEKSNLPTPAIRNYRIIEHRRLRSNELHYLDHPRFGMILKVSPVKVEIPEIVSEPENGDVSKSKLPITGQKHQN